jgi:hypothetical protein
VNIDNSIFVFTAKAEKALQMDALSSSVFSVLSVVIL